MKFIIETDDEIEAKRLIKATDMAMFIHNLVHRMFQDGGVKSNGEIRQEIAYALKDYSIEIQDLID